MPRPAISLLAACLALCSLTTPLFAADPGHENNGEYYNSKEEGWFWYKDPHEEEKKEVPPPASVAPKKDDKLSAGWLRANLQKLMDRAMDDPTEQNVAAYFYAQRVLLDKSQRFSEAAQQVTLTEPMLDESNRVPISTYGKRAFMETNYQAQEQALKYVASKVGGLFVFVDSTCSFCRAQSKTVNELAQRYGFTVKYISMDGKGIPEVQSFLKDNGLSKTINLKITPTTVLAIPPNNFIVVSQGVMAQEDLKRKILQAALMKEALPKELEAVVNPWDRGVLSAQDMEHGASDDPKAMTEYVKKALEAHY